jgi:hypothetical protein
MMYAGRELGLKSYLPVWSIFPGLFDNTRTTGRKGVAFVYSSRFPLTLLVLEPAMAVV